MCFYSNICEKFESNALRTLLHRAYFLSSNHTSFHAEVIFLEKLFPQNGYPIHLIQRLTNQFFNKIFTASKDTVENEPKLKMYVPLPFHDAHGEAEAVELLKKLSNWYPQLSFTLVLKNNHTMFKMFSYKDKIPDSVRSNVVYKFECEGCNTSYIGSTHQKFKGRISQYLGISDRSG